MGLGKREREREREREARRNWDPEVGPVYRAWGKKFRDIYISFSLEISNCCRVGAILKVSGIACRLTNPKSSNPVGLGRSDFHEKCHV